MNQMNTATIQKIKQRRTRRRTTHHHTWMTKSRRKLKEKKMKRGDFKSKIDSKSPLNEETERENLKEKKL